MSEARTAKERVNGGCVRVSCGKLVKDDKMMGGIIPPAAGASSEGVASAAYLCTNVRITTCFFSRGFI